jgi:hypothetical protein
MVAAAYDKHRAIVNFAKGNLTMKNAYIITLVIWALAIIVATPTLAEYSLVSDSSEHENTLDTNVTTSYSDLEEDEDEGHGRNVQCSNKNQTTTFIIINSIVILVLVLIIPFVAISVLYGNIGLFIWRKGRSQATNRVSPKHNQPMNTVVSRRVVRVVIMLITSVILFVIFRTPYFIVTAVSVRLRSIAKKCSDGSLIGKKNCFCWTPNYDQTKT